MQDYDHIIVGSGAGGSAAAYRLASAGRRVLLLEKGRPLPKDDATLDIHRVNTDPCFASREIWGDGQGGRLVPQERFNLGGKTKWYGAALLRFSPQEFAGDPGRQLLPWPFDYTELEPYYAEAERLLGVTHFAHEPCLQQLLARIRGVAPDWLEERLPLGLNRDILEHPEEARHFDGFASPRGLKADGETAFIDRVRRLPNLTISTGNAVERLTPSGHSPYRIGGVVCTDGSMHQADSVLLAAGALHSPGLLKRYLIETGLEARLPAADLVGRFYKSHLKTFLLAFMREPPSDMLRKTALLTHVSFPFSSIQTLGWLDGELLGAQTPSWIPRFVVNALGRHAYGFFIQTEDGSHPDNRVQAELAQPLLDFRSCRLPDAQREHRTVVAAFQKTLLQAGFPSATKAVPTAGSAHACGTLVAGVDANSAVVDGHGCVHGLENLYVVDGSVLPRSSRVNPALTIYAWSLRVTDCLIGANQLATTDRAVAGV